MPTAFQEPFSAEKVKLGRRPSIRGQPSPTQGGLIDRGGPQAGVTVSVRSLKNSVTPPGIKYSDVLM